jgi:hypothetical protein
MFLSAVAVDLRAAPLLGVMADYCFGGGAPPAAPEPGPRGSFLLAMQFLRNFVRSAPCSFWSSAPNLQVAIFSFAVTANDGVLGSMASSAAVKKIVR